MMTRPGWLLRLEELACLTAAVALYSKSHFNWLLFALLFLAPDIFMLGYLADARFGSAMYNLGHWLAIPVTLLVLAYLHGWPQMQACSLIWISHIAFDRMLGYGLKYPGGFRNTHIQAMG